MATRDDRIALVEAFWAAVAAGDEQRLRELCADGYRFTMSNGHEEDLGEWLARLRAEAATEAFDDFRVEIDEVVAGDDDVAVRGRERRRQVELFVGVESGERDVVQPFCGVFSFDGDEIADVRLVVDEGRFLRDLGVLPGDGLAWKLRQQHRDVLNRILRHDLRNDLNAALLRADQVADERLRREVRAPIEDLLALVEKTRHVEQHVVEQDVRPEPVDLPALVRGVVDEVTGRHPVGSVATRVAPDARVRTDPNVLETVLVECVGNAAVHCDRPAVTITVEDHPDGVVVTVADDGPGIPEYELSVIRRERVTPMVHGSGVGLWAIAWGVEKLGGDVTFEAGEDGGTVVTLNVPDL